MAASFIHPKMKGELRISVSVEELATYLVEYIAQLSENAVREKGCFSIALSGRFLIELIRFKHFLLKDIVYWHLLSVIIMINGIWVGCRKLCEPPYIRTVDWRHWYCFFADERGVAKDHVDSNYKLMKDEFLSRVHV